MLLTKTCILCGSTFESRQPASKYCAICRPRLKKASYLRKYRSKANNKCAVCGKAITDKARHCRNCAALILNSQQKLSSHPRWKGGRVYECDGYVRVLDRSHPRAQKSGYVYEHILVWEESHNMPLPDGYIVHHKNGIRNDNRPGNLFALLRKNHHSSLFIKELRKRIRELEGKLGQQKLI